MNVSTVCVCGYMCAKGVCVCLFVCVCVCARMCVRVESSRNIVATLYWVATTHKMP